MSDQETRPSAIAQAQEGHDPRVVVTVEQEVVTKGHNSEPVTTAFLALTGLFCGRFPLARPPGLRRVSNKRRMSRIGLAATIASCLASR